jgi:tetratricopeptide (TPR) repeat protein
MTTDTTSPASSPHLAAVLAAWLLDRAATYLQVHGRLAEARPLFERALAIDETSHGADHPTVAARLNNLALLLHDLGQPRQARPLAERALAITETSYGSDHPAVALRRDNLTSILQDLEEHDQAQPPADG